MSYAVAFTLLLHLLSLGTGELRGTLKLDEGIEAPQQLDATFEWIGQRFTVPCSVETSGAFQCRLPAAKLDVRLTAADFAPHYVWDAALSRERALTIPPFALKRGGSVIGWVAPPLEGLPAETTVRLTPVFYGGNPEDVKLLAQKQKPNARGFFQFTGVPGGEWRVVAEAPRYSPSVVAEVSVDERSESKLREPLSLRELVDLQVGIEPETYAANGPWRVRLDRAARGAQFEELVTDSAADEFGQWTHRGIAAGQYVLSILDPRGNSYNSTTFEAEPGMLPLQIKIDAVPVKGRVRIGGEPAVVRLHFYSGNREDKTLKTSEDGEFKTMLAKEGKWFVGATVLSSSQELAVRQINVARKEGERQAVVDLDYSGGRVVGRVVDESGKGLVTGVMLSRPGMSPVGRVSTEDGSFELIGIDPGPAHILAGDEKRQSGNIPVIVDENASPLTLVVRGLRKVDGWLVSPHGDPIAGASLRYYAPNGGFMSEVVSSPSGRFSFQVQPDTEHVHLSIVAPRFATKLMLLPTPDQKNKVEIVLSPQGGMMVLRPNDDARPETPLAVAHNGARMTVHNLIPPMWSGVSARPSWANEQGIALDLEPGEYSICASLHSDDCVKQTVSAGATSYVDTPRRK